jgi:hypothetical protein
MSDSFHRQGAKLLKNAKILKTWRLGVKDFDYCRTVDGVNSLMVERIIPLVADVTMSFDRDEYFSGDSIKLS